MKNYYLKAFAMGIVVAGVLMAIVMGYYWNRVISVRDGGTFVLGNRSQVKMLGINAPESGVCGSAEAKKELDKNIRGQKVRLVDKRIDEKGRILALVYVDKKLINKIMIDSGWVRWDGAKINLGELLSISAEEARLSEKGVYGKICRNSDRWEK